MPPSRLWRAPCQGWYCEGEAAPRQEFRRRRVEELLQSRRLVVMEFLAYMPTPFLFQELPRPIPPPLPPTVTFVGKS